MASPFDVTKNPAVLAAALKIAESGQPGATTGPSDAEQMAEATALFQQMGATDADMGVLKTIKLPGVAANDGMLGNAVQLADMTGLSKQYPGMVDAARQAQNLSLSGVANSLLTGQPLVSGEAVTQVENAAETVKKKAETGVVDTALVSGHATRDGLYVAKQIDRATPEGVNALKNTKALAKKYGPKPPAGGPPPFRGASAGGAPPSGGGGGAPTTGPAASGPSGAATEAGEAAADGAGVEARTVAEGAEVGGEAARGSEALLRVSGAARNAYGLFAHNAPEVGRGFATAATNAYAWGRTVLPESLVVTRAYWDNLTRVAPQTMTAKEASVAVVSLASPGVAVANAGTLKEVAGNVGAGATLVHEQTNASRTVLKAKAKVRMANRQLGNNLAEVRTKVVENYQKGKTPAAAPAAEGSAAVEGSEALTEGTRAAAPAAAAAPKPAVAAPTAAPAPAATAPTANAAPAASASAAPGTPAPSGTATAAGSADSAVDAATKGADGVAKGVEEASTAIKTGEELKTASKGFSFFKWFKFGGEVGTAVTRDAARIGFLGGSKVVAKTLGKAVPAVSAGVALMTAYQFREAMDPATHTSTKRKVALGICTGLDATCAVIDWIPAVGNVASLVVGTASTVINVATA